MSAVPVKPGQRVAFSKTVSESDVYLFAGITGDLAPNHVDEAYMATTAYGRRIAHGMLSGAFISAVLGYEFEARKIERFQITSRQFDSLPELSVYGRVKIAECGIPTRKTKFNVPFEASVIRSRQLARFGIHEVDICRLYAK